MDAKGNSLVAEIDHQWGNKINMSDCVRIVDFVSQPSVDQLKQLTFLDFSRITGINASDEELLRVVSLLSSRYGVLELHLVYFDEGGQAHDMNDDEVRFYLSTGKIADGSVGEWLKRHAQYSSPWPRFRC